MRISNKLNTEMPNYLSQESSKQNYIANTDTIIPMPRIGDKASEFKAITTQELLAAIGSSVQKHDH